MTRKDWIEEQLDLHVARRVEDQERIRVLSVMLRRHAQEIANLLGECVHKKDDVGMCDCWTEYD